MITTRTRWQHPTLRYAFTLLTHECCGLRWEVLLSSRFPGREREPVCPRCGRGDTSPPYDPTADYAASPPNRQAEMRNVPLWAGIARSYEPDEQ